MSNPLAGLTEGAVYGSRLASMEGPHCERTTRLPGDPWGGEEEAKPCLEPLERGLPGLYLSCFDMLLTEDATWLLKLSDGTSAPAAAAALFPLPRPEPSSREEPEQCPVIDSQGQSLSPGALSGQEEERSLEQVQTMVVGEVLKDIATACKLLNITPGEAAPPRPHVLSLALSADGGP